MQEIQKADDVTTVVTIMRHIDHPCVEPRTGRNNRYFWLERAEEALPRLGNPYARDLLEGAIREYRG